MSGYALRQAIHDVLGHFWSESFGQIYPALADLEKRGLVRRSGGERTGASTFAATPEGVGVLRDLLAEPIQTAPPRNGLLLRLFFGRQLGAETCAALIASAKAEAENRLSAFAAIRAEVTGEVETAPDHPYWLVTVAAGEHAARATISWAEEAMETLSSGVSRSAGDERGVR